MNIISREYPRKKKYHGEGKPYYEYQWVIESLDKDGEIINVETNDINEFPGLPNENTDIALRRINGLIDGGGEDMGGDFSYAYLDRQGNLNPTWDQTNEKVPVKWRKIVAKQIKLSAP
jgi:hypothetical protein